MSRSARYDCGQTKNESLKTSCPGLGFSRRETLSLKLRTQIDDLNNFDFARLHMACNLRAFGSKLAARGSAARSWLPGSKLDCPARSCARGQPARGRTSWPTRLRAPPPFIAALVVVATRRSSSAVRQVHKAPSPLQSPRQLTAVFVVNARAAVATRAACGDGGRSLRRRGHSAPCPRLLGAGVELLALPAHAPDPSAAAVAAPRDALTLLMP